MPAVEDVPFEVRHYASPRSLPVGVADRRTGADTLLILSGTVVLPPTVSLVGPDEKVQRKRVRFVLPQTPKVVTAGGQIVGSQVVSALASIHLEGGGERTFAIDQAVVEWAADLNELRATIDVAFQGTRSAIHRVMYNAFVLARVG